VSFLIENQDKDIILRDMLNKLNKYFSLSRKQIAFARRLVRQHDERDARKAEREAKLADTPDWSEGRYEVSGKVLKTKWVDNDFGSSCKMLFELEDGRRCWGTLPKKLEDINLDKIVLTIKATFVPSNDDKKFAFYKRPSVVSSVA
jgi:hypothetical protein